LTVIAAGPTAAVAALAPVFESYGNRTVHVSEKIGDAQTVKLINNVLSAANLAMACEAITFGTSAGIPAEKILEVVNTGTGHTC
jgi:3-hydroxyisobutyrate dehydrogenase-like beta-hydroxyacid dehydrogenase